MPNLCNLSVIEPICINANGSNEIPYYDIKSKLVKEGAILVRGFQIKTAEEFRIFLLNIGIEPLTSYSLGPEQREIYAPGVFTSTNRDGSFLIHLHTEVSYKRNRPRYIAFFSFKAAKKHSETPICDLIKVYSELSKKLRHKLENTPSCHFRLIPWSDIGIPDENGIYRSGNALWCRDKSRIQIEEELKLSTMKFKWTSEGIETEIEIPLIIRHPESGLPCIQSNFEYWPVYILRNAYKRQWRRLFTTPFTKFNFIVLLSIAFPYLADIYLLKFQHKRRRIYLSSSRKDLLTKSELSQISKSLWDNTILFSWQQHDILVLDNFRFGHGRMNVPHKNQRLTFTSIGNPLDITPYIFNYE
jgi:alpha-ketoglutarate-dependent taurine dioxygenase